MFTCNTLHIFNLKRKNSVSNFVSRTQKGSKSSHWKHVTDFNNLQQIFLHLFISWEQIKFCRKVCSKSPKKTLLQKKKKKISFHISNFFLGLKEFSLKKTFMILTCNIFHLNLFKKFVWEFVPRAQKSSPPRLMFIFQIFFQRPKELSLKKSHRFLCILFSM